MYTVIPRPEVIDHGPQSGGPAPQIIDHRNGNPGKWKGRHRTEQLPYDSLKNHRDTLLNAEFKYKRRIKELEKQNEDMVTTYEQTYQENKVLKSIIEHGPDAVKMKKLQLDKKEKKGLIEQLEEENRQLHEKFKELERLYGAPKDFALEKDWKEALARARKKREEEDAIPTQGPFAGAKLFKKKRVTIDDDRLEDRDSYDLTLDNVEKETQILLNKIRQLKREKDQIDYAMLMGKGAISRNATVATAINDKLNRDLNKFAIRLEKLKLKHRAAKEFHGTTNKEILEKMERQRLEEHYVNSSQSPHTDQSDVPVPWSAKTTRTYKARKVNNNDSTAERVKSTNAEERIKTSMSPRESIPENEKATVVQNTPSNIAFKSTTVMKSAPVKQLHTDTKEKELNIKSAKEAKDKKVTVVSPAKDRIHSKSWTDTVGRYTHGPEPIRRKPKTATSKNNDHKETTDAETTSPRIPKITFPFPRKSTGQESPRTNTVRTPYDAVLEYLKIQNDNRPQKRASTYAQAREIRTEKQTALSPIPIHFKSDGRIVNGNEIRQVMGNTGLRSQDHFYKYL